MGVGPRTGTLSETADERLEALRTGPYGRCVYRCANDAVDNQVVMMELASGAAGVLSVHGHADDDQRTVRYDGTAPPSSAASATSPGPSSPFTITVAGGSSPSRFRPHAECTVAVTSA